MTVNNESFSFLEIAQIILKSYLSVHFSFYLCIYIDDSPLDPDNLLVTASHAIFHEEDRKKAPVAVVGYHFQHSALRTFFKNITSNVSIAAIAAKSNIYRQ